MAKDPGDEFWRQSRETKQTKILTFALIMLAPATLKAVPLQLHCKWDAYDVENTADNARRRHPGRQNSSRSHSGNRIEVFIWQNFLPASRDLGNQASPPSHKNTLKI